MDNDENRSPPPSSETLKNTKDSVTLECDFCFKEFDSKQKLISHITEHSVETDRAEDSITPGPSLKTNKRNQKDQPENVYICSYCNKKYKSAKVLKGHVLDHTGRQPYVCKVCGRKFTKLRGLTRHKNSRHSDRHCDVCNKQFEDKYRLDRHKLVHTKEKPYLCDTCGRGFTEKQYLVDHLNKHFGVKTYSCEGCKRKFTHGYQKTWHIKKCKAYEKNWFVTTSPERLEKKDYNLRKKKTVTGERSSL